MRFYTFPRRQELGHLRPGTLKAIVGETYCYSNCQGNSEPMKYEICVAEELNKKEAERIGKAIAEMTGDGLRWLT